MLIEELNKLLLDATNGSRASLSKLITILERGDQSVSWSLVDNLKHSFRDSYIVGFVGPPGAGKSTLLGKIVKKFTEKNSDERIAVLTVDPTSPLSGGSFMGNRIRMIDDIKGKTNQIFVRSFSAKQSVGGLTVQVYFASKLLSLAGYKNLFIEGVGAGHLDIKPILYSHTRIAVLTPTSGDIIQMLKAGVMELCDIYIINRADEGNPSFVKSQLEETIRLRAQNGGWIPPVLTTVAREDRGIDMVYDAILQHKKHLIVSGDYEKRIKEMALTEVKDIFMTEVNVCLEDFIQRNDALIHKYIEKDNRKSEIISYVVQEVAREIFRRWNGQC